MKVPYEWLKEYVETGDSLEEFCGKLTALGFETTVAGKSGGYTVLDVEVFSNRPDCLSIIGIAREVSAATGKPLKLPGFSHAEAPPRASESLAVLVETRACGRYCAKMVRNVKVGPSPGWMAERLEAAGIRTVNNVVDATNYCLLEMGHPLHAFDMAKISGRKIAARMARKGEKITTIDGSARQLEPWMMVISDARRPVALAGVMGGRDSEVSAGTGEVLLEGAYFSPSLIRKTAKHFQMETEASYRFQRGADIEGIVSALDRAAALIEDAAGGETAGGTVDEYPGKAGREAVELRAGTVERILGEKIGEDFIKKKLEGLGFGVEAGEGAIKISVPSRRQDVSREIDVVEEIARLYGYDRIPSRIPAGEIPPARGARGKDFAREAGILLSGYGMNEAINHSLISGEAAALAAPEGVHVRILNPINEEQSVMRPSLIPGLVSNVAANLRHGASGVRMFEIGAVFRIDGKRKEKLFVSGAMAGAVDAHWKRAPEKFEFAHAKGIVEALMNDLKMEQPVFSGCACGMLDASRSASVEFSGRRCGFLGGVSENLAAHYGLDAPAFVFELDLEAMLESSPPGNTFRAIPKFPGCLRDLAVIVAEDVKSADLRHRIMDAGRGLVEDAKLFDVYRGKQVPRGYKSLAFSIVYRAGDRTLRDEEVDRAHAGIVEALLKGFEGRLRE